MFILSSKKARMITSIFKKWYIKKVHFSMSKKLTELGGSQYAILSVDNMQLIQMPKNSNANRSQSDVSLQK